NSGIDSRGGKMNWRCAGHAVAVPLLLAVPIFAQTPKVDDDFRQKDAAGRLEVLDHTRDACDRANDITITSATDGPMKVRPNETRYFKIRQVDAYTKSGGWRWRCGNSEERARISGAVYVKVVRNARGVIDWYSVRERP